MGRKPRHLSVVKNGSTSMLSRLVEYLRSRPVPGFVTI